MNTFVLGLIILIVVILAVAFWNSTKIVGRYQIYEEDGVTKKSEVTIKTGATADAPLELHIGPLVYILGSWNGLGFDLISNGVAILNSTLKMNPITGGLTLVLSGKEYSAVKFPEEPETATSNTNSERQTTSEISSGTYLGCWTDNSVRALPKHFGSMTWKGCMDAVKNVGAKYMGWQDGNNASRGWQKAECWGGSGDYKKYGENKSCAPFHNQDKIGGRGWSNAVYKV